MPKTQKGLVGSVLVNVWGYSMTIVHFYKVVRETEKTVVVVRLKGVETATGYLSGTAVPSDTIAEEKEYRLVKRLRGDEMWFVGSMDGSIMNRLRLWDGKPEYFNHCD